MRRLAGQAARHTGRLAHALAQLVLALVLTSIGLLAVLSWRLSQGPLELPWLAGQLQAAADIDASAHLTIRSAALAWEGFAQGVDRPLDIRVTGIVVTDASGRRLAAIPRAEVSLSAGRLLFGQIVPRAIEVDGARLRVLRAADGGLTLDLGGLLDNADVTPGAGAPSAASGGVPSDVLRELLHPAVGDRARGQASHWSQLRHVRIRDALVRVTDQQLGAIWGLSHLTVDLQRGNAGGVTGQADAALQLGTESTHLTAQATLDQATGRTSITASLGPVVPATLARDVKAAAALAPLDAPVALSATVLLDPALAPEHITAHAVAGAGTLRLPQQTTTLAGATLAADGTPTHMALALSQLEIAPRPGGNHTVIQAHADLTRAPAGDITATATVDLDQVAFADLPALWPKGVGGPGARSWIAQNITAGTARNGQVDIGLHIPADLSGVDVTRVEGGIDGDGLTVYWLRPVPPIEDGTARLSFAGTDALAITVTGGRQAGGSQGGLRIEGGHALFSGLNAPDQYLDIDASIAGPVADLLTLLHNPRIKLLDRSPLPISDAAGQIAGTVTVAHLPLRGSLSMDDVNIQTTVKLAGLRLPGIVAGRDLDQGDLSLQAGPDGLHADGSATLAGIPAKLRLDLDFHAGPPSEVLQTVAVSGTVDVARLATLGLPTGGVLTGSATVAATLTVQRDHAGVAAVNADLAQAALTVAPLGFTKPAGKPATLAATIRLDGNTLTGIAPIHLAGPGLLLDAAVDFAGGKPTTLTVQRLQLGDTTDLHGTLTIPHSPGESWRVTVAGPSIDAAGEVAHKPARPRPPARTEPPPGPPYIADARFDRVLLGKGHWIAGVVAHVEDDGRVMQRASITGRTVRTGGGGAPASPGGGTPFDFAITPQGGTRQLSITTADAGGLLLALDIDDMVQGGRLNITGSYDDQSPAHPLVGSVRVEDFRVHDAPMLGRLLQAMTLYGLVQVASGPGLGFTQLIAPFRLSDNVLELTGARAFSPSLGMTAKGSLDLTTRVANLTGTIVPAYFFNSLLGDIPLIGKLFSPEKGGGLFAATYTVKGPLADPSVSVNPLAALTPGFLRGAFGLFDQSPSTGSSQTLPRGRPSK